MNLCGDNLLHQAKEEGDCSYHWSTGMGVLLPHTLLLPYLHEHLMIGVRENIVSTMQTAVYPPKISFEQD